jgi:RNA polymerase sigma factor (sigma-70 family)
MLRELKDAEVNRVTRQEFGDAYQNRGFRGTIRRLRKRGVNYDQAEDLAQEAWARGLEHLEQLRDETLLTFWIDSIATNLFSSACRREWRISQLPSDHEAASEIDLASIDLRRALGRCSPRQGVLLELVYLRGDTAAEAARSLGISTDAVYGALARARAAMRFQLKAACRARRRPWRNAHETSTRWAYRCRHPGLFLGGQRKTRQNRRAHALFRRPRVTGSAPSVALA